MSLSKYRTIDLLIFTGIGVLLDVIIGIKGFFRIVLYLAISIPLILLCYVRWGKFGLLPNLVIIVVHNFLYAESLWINLGHSLALLSLSLALFWIRWEPLKKRRIPLWAIALYYLGCTLVMSLFEWSFWQIGPVSMPLVTYVANYGFNWLLGLGLTLVIGLQKDIYVPMMVYLKDVAEEKEKNKGN